MVESSWHEFVRPLVPDDVAKLERVRAIVEAFPENRTVVHSSEVQFRRTRIYASAYVKSHYLELGIELTREVDDPAPRTAFPTSKVVVLNRYAFRELDQVDDRIEALLREAYETVGPGFR